MARILAVDDSPTQRALVSEALERAGHDVTLATDGVEALKAAQDESFDLVLSDVNMPNMDGIELTRELRALASYRFVPILMLTTEGPELKQSARKAGATGWLAKPFDPKTLLATIHRVLP